MIALNNMCTILYISPDRIRFGDIVCCVSSFRACLCGASSGGEQSGFPLQREQPAHQWLPRRLHEALCKCSSLCSQLIRGIPFAALTDNSYPTENVLLFCVVLSTI